MQADAIREQVNRICSSSFLAQAARLSSFLKFIVEAHLRGEAGSLKEYAIGVEVFERGADFDMRIDNVVRIQAAKLRSRLIEYYASAGVADAIVISIPKGSYAPEIRERSNAPVTPTTSDKSRIVVLPFVNMSSDPENEYFSDGLTEELINRLACNPELQVVARTSAFRFKGRNEDIREVGAKLNVGTVLEGSVRRSGSLLRVTAQLIDVETGFHLFSKTYQREFKDIFQLQDELSQAVANEISPQSPVQKNESTNTSTTNLDAYNAYLRGMFAMANRYLDLSRCVECFHEALALDPNYAPAWAGLAQGYFLITWFYRMPSEQTTPLAKEASRRAIKLDPELAQAQSTRGVVECTFEWNWKSAEEWFRKSVERQPGFGGGSLFYAFCCLMPQLRLDEACAVIERSLTVDPYNGPLHAGAIFIYARAGRYEKAERQYVLAQEYVPHYPPIHGSAGMAYKIQGKLHEALAAFRLSSNQSANAPFVYSSLGDALAATGDVQAAEKIAAEMAAQAIAPADIARVYSGLRNKEETLRWLEIALDQHCIHLLMVAADPGFDWVRSEPRFARIIESMGLREAHAAPA